MRKAIEYSSDGQVYPNVGTHCTLEEGKTRQEEADQADINKIVKRAMQGLLPLDVREGIYADVSGITDFRDAMEKVQRGEEAFSTLNADVRAAFSNSPAEFLDAFHSEEGVAKLRKLGVVPEPQDVVLDRAEAAAEARAEKRREAREVAKRVEAAKSPPVEAAKKQP